MIGLWLAVLLCGAPNPTQWVLTTPAYDRVRQSNECPVCGAVGVGMVLHYGEPEPAREIDCGSGMGNWTTDAGDWGDSICIGITVIPEVKANAYRCPNDGLVWMP
jgi:hypothetical protein